MKRLFAILLLAGAVALPVVAQEKYELGKAGFEKIEAPEPGTPEAGLQDVRRLIAERENKAAIKTAKTWIKEHPNHPLLAEAYLLRGDAKAQRERFYDALFDYEFVIRSYPGSEQFHSALERELAVADAFGRGVKRHFLGLRILPAAGEAEELYIRIQERSPGSKVAERAGIALADFYYRRSEMQLAAEGYELFLKNYPDSQWREHAMQRHILANLATFKGPLFDSTGLIESRQRLTDYEQDFPAAAERLGAEPLRTRIDETLASRAYQIARWYETRGKPVSAVVMYKQVLKDHGGSVAARQATDRLRKLEPELFDSGGLIGLGKPEGTAKEPVSQPAAVRQGEGLKEERPNGDTQSSSPTESTDAPPPPRKQKQD